MYNTYHITFITMLLFQEKYNNEDYSNQMRAMEDELEVHVHVHVQGGEPKIALSLYNRQQSQVQFLVPHPV